MRFLVDNSKKIIFGWSAKCGCSHVKKIYYYLQNNKIDNAIHIPVEYNINLPNDIENYKIILFIRNPYKRLVSGFLDKYKLNGQFRKHWTYNNLTFSLFVNELIMNRWTNVDYHHFTPQLTEHFNKDIIEKCSNIKIFDIENIDYTYIEQLYNKKIPDQLLNFRGGHERKIYDNIMNENVYNLELDSYIDKTVDLKYFYNNDIKNKVYDFYSIDFLYFKEKGFDYNNSTF